MIQESLLSKLMKKTIGLLIVFIFIFSIFSYKDRWMGFIYPGGNLSGTPIIRSGFKSLDDCRAWVDETEKDGDDHECGKNCKPMDSSDMYICDETLD